MRCQICFELGGLVVDYDTEKMRSHSEVHQKQINQDADDPEKIFQFCFPNAAIKNLDDESGDQEKEIKDEQLLGGKKIGITTRSPKKIKIRTRGPVQRHFKRLYDKFGRDRKIACRLCSKDVYCGKSSAGSVLGVNHVLRHHFGKCLFTCRYCPKGYKTRVAATAHIIKHHQKTSVGGYVDHGQKYESQIKAILTKCFGMEGEKQTDQNLDDSGAKKIQRARKMISQKKMETENRDQINEGEKMIDTIPKTKGTAASGSGAGKRRYYCDNCNFSTKFEKLMKNHRVLFHR